MTKMTKKFFREEILKSYGYARQLLPTILKRYGVATKVSPRKAYYKLWLDNDSIVDGYNRDTSWHIRGFELGTDGKVYIMIYWQGDSTDGDDYIQMPTSSYDYAHLPSSKPYKISGDYYVDRNAITIYPSEIYDAIKGLKF